MKSSWRPCWTKIALESQNLEKHKEKSAFLGLPRGVLEASWRLLEALGGFLEALGGLLEALEGVLEASWMVLEALMAKKSENLQKNL